MTCIWIFSVISVEVDRSLKGVVTQEQGGSQLPQLFQFLVFFVIVHGAHLRSNLLI